MRWYRALILENVQVDTDATRNPVCELRETGESVLVRATPYSPSHNQNEGNAFDMAERTFLTKASPSLLERMDAIKVQGAVWEVTGKTCDASPVAIRARRSKHGL